MAGEFIIGDHTVIGAWANVRAAGGRIEIGRDVMIGQLVSLLAANHRRDELGCNPHEGRWDESRTGVRVEDGAWIGADVVVLPGVTVGRRAVLAAGSVAARDVPAGEVRGGISARQITRSAASG